MSETKKRGRKVKSVNFDNVSDNTIPSEYMDEIIILTLPVSYTELISRSFNNNFIDDKITNILTENPGLIKAINSVVSNKDTFFKKNNIVKEMCNNKEEIFEDINRNGEKISVNIKTFSVLPVEISYNNILKVKAIKTNICCWWCCHNFDNFPICAPYKYDIKSKFFKVKGCFCSFNCAKSYSKTDHIIKDKSLLNFMKKIITGESYSSIHCALPKEILKKFGGYMEIDEYRKTFSVIKKYNFNNYPMIYNPLQVENIKELELVQDSKEKIKSNKISKPLVMNNHNTKQTAKTPEPSKRSLSNTLGIKKVYL